MICRMETRVSPDWPSRLEALEASRRRLRWGVGVLSCLAVALVLGGAGWPTAGPFAPGGGLPGTGPILEANGTLAAALEDPLYDDFLQEFEVLRRAPKRRRYLIGHVLAAAAAHRVDPDLLFALVAVESRFDSTAVSPKGARGLGQVLFSTAREVAPEVVREPEDLHVVPRNLHATARYLRQLLDAQRGDVRAALRAYYAGPNDRHSTRRDRVQYVGRVSTHYAYLKAHRSHRHLTAMAPAEARTAQD